MSGLSGEPVLLDRAQKLGSVCAGLPLAQDFPLAKEMTLDPALFRALQHAVGSYIEASLLADGQRLPFTDFEDLVARHHAAILKLPNVTPNGIIRPKLDNFLEFNAVQRRLADIVESLGFEDRILRMRLPISLRLVEGAAPTSVVSRPRATNKMHSDFWTGGCCDLAILVPVLGDVGSTTVKFGEPRGMVENFLVELPDYDAGATLYERFEPYALQMRTGHAYFQDIYCLHGTHREGGGPRVSVDWTAQTVNYPEIEARHSSKVLATDNHFDLATWCSIGRRMVFVDEESMAETRARFAAGPQAEALVKGSAVAGQTSPQARFIDLLSGQDSLPIARFE